MAEIDKSCGFLLFAVALIRHFAEPGLCERPQGLIPPGHEEVSTEIHIFLGSNCHELKSAGLGSVDAYR